MPDNDRMRALITGAERLGVIGSPSSTSQLALDIMGTAATRKLVGELALLEFPQDEAPITLWGRSRRSNCATSGTKTRPCAV